MRIVIIGNGIAGTNAARYIRKQSDHEVIMISEETLQPFSRTALMYIYMGHLKQENTWMYEDWFWAKNRIQRVQARVEKVLTADKTLLLHTGEQLTYDQLIIATGSKPNKFGWPGQDLPGVQGLYHLQDLATMEQYSAGLQHAIIVGGGLIGIEMAEMFHSRHIPVTFLVRESSFWNSVLPPEESEMINRHIREQGIDLRLSTELSSIHGSERVESIETNSGERIHCGFVGLTVGVSPNIDFLKDSGIETRHGVLVDEYLRASAPDVYAIGDCAQLRAPGPGRRAIEAIWYTGRMMGQTVARNICAEPAPYQPRLWFNSAKFFDIEYQVYGDIPAQTPEGVTSLYWEHTDGKKAIRINYETHSGAVRGFNLMGVRYRHEVCERWILEKKHIEIVLSELSSANFDPEFYDRYELNLAKQYYSRTEKTNHHVKAI
ncbi:MAG TPA: FAD-dependent oxidoreductase [Saprospirales bacterium]|nr:FAD-dependent oxidoreductase [Saprospirales bacterium]